MIAEIVSAGVSPGIHITSRPTEHTAVIASSFSMQSAPLFAASIIPASSETGINAPESPPILEQAITPPFFNCVIEQGEGCCCAMCTALFKSYFLEDMGNRVAYCRSRSK